MKSSKKTQETFSIDPFHYEELALLDAIDLVEERWPMVYILSNQGSKTAYIGESTNIRSRLRTHLSKPDKKRLGMLHLISSSTFNKSVTLELESSLLKYMSADEKFKLLNGNAGLLQHEYYDKKQYRQLFGQIWKKLKKEGLVLHDLKDIDQTDLFKFSPYKSLSPDQYQSVEDLVKLLTKKQKGAIFISGSAGTGKTVLAIFLAKLLMTDQPTLIETGNIEDGWVDFILQLKQKFPNPKIGMVVPMTPLRKTLKRNFGYIKDLSSRMVVGPAELAKKPNDTKYDILIVDEAHRLKQAKNLTNYGDFNRNNKLMGLGKDGTELDWIMARSHAQIFFYDADQTVRPTDVDESAFNKAMKNAIGRLELRSQLRVLGGKDYIEYVDKLMKGALTTKKPVTFGNDYEFFLFDSLQAMIRRLKQKEKEYKLCRLVAGFGWQWISNRDKKAHDIKLEGLKLRWNSRPQDWIHSEEARSMKEAGSIHTTQGYDLNYAGVIFGKEISYDEDAHRIVIKKDHYHDKYGKFGANDGQLKKFITNIYKILMYRGVRGTYVYVCDEKLRNYFRQHILPFNAGVGTKIVPLHEKDNYFNDVPLDLSAESEDEDATKKSPGDGK